MITTSARHNDVCEGEFEVQEKPASLLRTVYAVRQKSATPARPQMGTVLSATQRLWQRATAWISMMRSEPAPTAPTYLRQTVQTIRLGNLSELPNLREVPCVVRWIGGSSYRNVLVSPSVGPVRSGLCPTTNCPVGVLKSETVRRASLLLIRRTDSVRRSCLNGQRRYLQPGFVRYLGNYRRAVKPRLDEPSVPIVVRGR